MLIVVRAVIVTSLFVFASMPVWACRCNVDTISESVNESTAIMIGKIVNLEVKESETRLSDNLAAENQFVTVKIIEKIKGLTGLDEVVIRTGTGHPDCAFFFKLGEKYLIYTTQKRGYEMYLPYFSKNLYTDRCTRTKKLSDSEEDLEILKKTFSEKK